MALNQLKTITNFFLGKSVMALRRCNMKIHQIYGNHLLRVLSFFGTLSPTSNVILLNVPYIYNEGDTQEGINK